MGDLLWDWRAVWVVDGFCWRKRLRLKSSCTTKLMKDMVQATLPVMAWSSSASLAMQSISLGVLVSRTCFFGIRSGNRESVLD